MWAGSRNGDVFDDSFQGSRRDSVDADERELVLSEVPLAVATIALDQLTLGVPGAVQLHQHRVPAVLRGTLTLTVTYEGPAEKGSTLASRKMADLRNHGVDTSVLLAQRRASSQKAPMSPSPGGDRAVATPSGGGTDEWGGLGSPRLSLFAISPRGGEPFSPTSPAGSFFSPFSSPLASPTGTGAKFLHCLVPDVPPNDVHFLFFFSGGGPMSPRPPADTAGPAPAVEASGYEKAIDPSSG